MEVDFLGSTALSKGLMGCTAAAARIVSIAGLGLGAIALVGFGVDAVDGITEAKNGENYTQELLRKSTRITLQNFRTTEVKSLLINSSIPKYNSYNKAVIQSYWRANFFRIKYKCSSKRVRFR